MKTETRTLPEFLLTSHPIYMLANGDPETFKSVFHELKRQEHGLEMIASENHTSEAVLAANGSVLTNKYAEGYAGKRFYGGCEYIDEVETLAINRSKAIFKAQHSNVQPHSGTTANQAVFNAIMEPGDKILSMKLDHGGHLSHGSPANAIGRLYNISNYGVKENGFIDYDQVRDQAKKTNPRVIIAGGSAYPRSIDFEFFREVADEVNAFLLVDMAHFAGLVAAGLLPSPVDYAHVTTTTTHKTLRGPRGGMILLGKDYEMEVKYNGRLIPLHKAIDSSVFPGMQGGPLEHVIAAKAVAFGEVLDENNKLNPSFIDYQKSVIENAVTLANYFVENGYDVASGGTDTHLILIKEPRGLSGKCAQYATEKIGITINKNAVPNDKRSPFVASGIRIGTPAITTRGMGEDEMYVIGESLDELFKVTQEGEKHMPTFTGENKKTVKELKGTIDELCNQYPLYPNLLKQFEYISKKLDIKSLAKYLKYRFLKILKKGGFNEARIWIGQ